jgi:hypothetical protein
MTCVTGLQPRQAARIIAPVPLKPPCVIQTADHKLRRRRRSLPGACACRAGWGTAPAATPAARQQQQQRPSSAAGEGWALRAEAQQAGRQARLGQAWNVSKDNPRLLTDLTKDGAEAKQAGRHVSDRLRVSTMHAVYVTTLALLLDGMYNIVSSAEPHQCVHAVSISTQCCSASPRRAAWRCTRL